MWLPKSAGVYRVVSCVFLLIAGEKGENYFSLKPLRPRFLWLKWYNLGMESHREGKVALKEEVLVRCEATKTRLNSLIREVMGEWERSLAEVDFPDHVLEREGKIFFDENEKKGDSKRVIAGATKAAILEGEIFLAVKTDFKGQLFWVGKTIPSEDQNEKVLVCAFFSPYYFEICRDENMDPRETVRDWLVQLFYWDVKLNKEKSDRAKFKPVTEADSWVKIYANTNKNTLPSVIYL